MYDKRTYFKLFPASGYSCNKSTNLWIFKKTWRINSYFKRSLLFSVLLLFITKSHRCFSFFFLSHVTSLILFLSSEKTFCTLQQVGFFPWILSDLGLVTGSALLCFDQWFSHLAHMRITCRACSNTDYWPHPQSF